MKDDIPSKLGIKAIIFLALIAVMIPSSLLAEVDYSYEYSIQVVKEPQREIKVSKDTKTIIKEVFPPHLRQKALQIANCESTMNAKAHGDKHLTFHDYNNGELIGDSIGLFQIRTGGRNYDGTQWNRARANGKTAEEFRAWMFDPTENAKYALSIYNRYGWQPWSCSGAS